jgi:solute carrier family 13 (sodium-dependent dicarboxylate transporter), member 2/3/5
MNITNTSAKEWEHYKTSFIVVAGLLVSLGIYFLHPFPTPSANTAIAIAFLMIYLWVTEIVPMPIVALLPIVLFPLLNLMPIKEVAKAYGNEVIFLFMGGFMIGLAIEKWNLHKRIALTIVKLTGTSGNKIILGFIIATGFLSMWLSNTATTMMMFPIALSVIKVMNDSSTQGNKKHFALSLMLVIAYASNFGGIATIIGTPPNVAFVNYIETQYHYTIGFLDWVLVCTPISLLLLVALYILVTKVLFKNGIADSADTNLFIKSEMEKLGSISKAEKRVLFIFITTALLWIFKKPLVDYTGWNIDDNMIAIFGAFLLFIVNSGTKDAKGKDLQLMEWSDTDKMAWGILLLFGGGIALANLLEKVGIMQQVGNGLAGISSSNVFVLILLVTVISIFLSEVMSNVAQVIVLAPVIGGFAVAMHINPLLLGIPMTLAASAASMLPMGTPPNAIVFSSGHIKMKEMIKAGFIINTVSIILITLFSYYVLPLVMGSIGK